jgi:steroid delta-isomerase-like uncharacterized protein
METEINKAVVRETAQRLFNEGDLSAVDELIAADAVDQCEPPGTDCRAHFRQVVTMLRTAFPDFHMAIDDMAADGNAVAVRLTMTGTHNGPFIGIPPTGKRVSVQQMRFMRFRDGQMIESWSIIDWPAWRQQLGAEAAPTNGAARVPQPAG